jgi:hypothetical protein
MQRAHALFYRVRVVGSSMSLFRVGPADKQLLPQCVGTAKALVSFHCGLERREVVGPAPALYRGSVKAGTDGHRVGDELGFGFAPSFQQCAWPNCEQAGCSHSGKVRALVILYSYRIADLRGSGVRLWMCPVGDRPPPPETIWGKEG